MHGDILLHVLGLLNES